MPHDKELPKFPGCAASLRELVEIQKARQKSIFIAGYKAGWNDDHWSGAEGAYERWLEEQEDKT